MWMASTAKIGFQLLYFSFVQIHHFFFFSLRHPWFQSLVQVYAFVRLMEVTASERSPNSPPRLPWHRDTGPQSWPGKSAVGIDLPHPAGPEFQSPGLGGKFYPPTGHSLTRPGRHKWEEISSAFL